jgi:V/A-type H+-transporting ATPase subunit B
MPARLTVEGAATRLDGPLLFLRRVVEAGLNDAVEVLGSDGRPRLGRVATLDEAHIVIEVLESTAGLALPDTRVRLHGGPLQFNVGPGILGRVFNGVGQPIDGGPPVAAERSLPIEGFPLNPVERSTPLDFIETGISTIDLMNSLVRGQKLPLFSGGRAAP